jgi:hypothetical protein
LFELKNLKRRKIDMKNKFGFISLAFLVSMAATAFGANGTLLVSGTPGMGQTNVLFVQQCQTDSTGQPTIFGCVQGKNYVINQTISLSPGTYYISYSHIPYFVQIVASQQTLVPLKPLLVGATRDPSKTFSVFMDFNDSSMQDVLLKDYYSNPNNRFYVVNLCGTNYGSNSSKPCTAWAAGSYQALFNTVLAFNSDASVSTFLQKGGFQNAGRLEVADPEFGQFLSVFPGVYGVVIKENKSGKILETDYGIKK